jgi:hypothetical protein
MATITDAGKSAAFFADPGPLIIPVSVVAGGEKRGMIAAIVKAVPDLANTFKSARRTGLLKPGGSFTVRLVAQEMRTLILMGLAIGPAREESAQAALQSVKDQIVNWHLSEVALHVPSEKALAVAEKAIETWPAGTKVRIYHPEWARKAESVAA